MKVAQLCLTCCNPVDCSPPVCPWNSSGKNTGVGCHSLLWGVGGGLPDPGIEPGSPAQWADSLLSEPSGKPSEAGSACSLIVASLARPHLPVAGAAGENLVPGQGAEALPLALATTIPRSPAVFPAAFSLGGTVYSDWF